MSETKPLTMTAEREAHLRKSPSLHREGYLFAELDAERAAHLQTIESLKTHIQACEVAVAEVERLREKTKLIIQAADKLADALEQMPLGIIGWPQDVSKRTLEIRDAALAQYAALKEKA